jgi:hypothetical protein
LEFEEGDFVWMILTKDRFPLGEYNKLAARKIGPVEIVKKINANEYQLKLPSHNKTSDVFNIKHLVPFIDDSSKEDANSRANSLQPGEDDVDQDAWDYMRNKGRDVKVEPPRRMTTRSQTRAAAEDQKQSFGAAIDCRLTYERLQTEPNAKLLRSDRGDRSQNWRLCVEATEEATDDRESSTRLCSIAPVLRSIAHGVLCYFSMHLLTTPTLVSLF